MNTKNPFFIGYSATAVAHPNIAFIKYWGNRDESINLPSNGSISMNLGDLEARTTVTFTSDLSEDVLSINHIIADQIAHQRISIILEIIRQKAKISLHARVDSVLNFPIGTGIASSAAGFAALAKAAIHAAGLESNETEISRLARLGSGSACRSVPGGFVEWHMGKSDDTSYATSIFPANHWEIYDLIIVLQKTPKKVGSKAGHFLANTSPLQASRIQDAPRRLEKCRNAIKERDFSSLANIIELDSNMMHAITMTSTPPLLYWEAGSLALMHAVPQWRAEGLHVAYSIDAGPNVHLICQSEDVDEIKERASALVAPQEILLSAVGGSAYIVRTV
jgi:diphosphomevalonate decarboxylase